MKPEAEIDIDEPLVRALLSEQHPELAGLPLIRCGEGWDNALFRLGGDLCVRLPRRSVAAALIEHEQRWLPLLADRLPLAVPRVVCAGRPGCGFPWAWSVTVWLPGEPATRAGLRDPAAAADALGRFLRALHQPALPAAPRNPWRGVPLATRDGILRDQLSRLEDIDGAAVLDLWNRALAAPAWPGPPLWIHGDLHPGNLLVHDGQLSGVIDFGDLTAGDPATDLAVMWMLLPASARPVLLAAARGGAYPLEDDTLLRARGWAVALGVACFASADPDLAPLGRRTIAAALAG